MKENKGEQFLHESLRKEMDHASRWKLLFWPFLSQPFSQCKIRDCGDDFARLKNQVKMAKLYGNLVKVVCSLKSADYFATAKIYTFSSFVYLTFFTMHVYMQKKVCIICFRKRQIYFCHRSNLLWHLLLSDSIKAISAYNYVMSCNAFQQYWSVEMHAGILI